MLLQKAICSRFYRADYKTMSLFSNNAALFVRVLLKVHMQHSLFHVTF